MISLIIYSTRFSLPESAYDTCSGIVKSSGNRTNLTKLLETPKISMGTFLESTTKMDNIIYRPLEKTAIATLITRRRYS
jgi:hypothetical protein